MTVSGLKILHELRGVSCIPLELEPPPKRVTTVSRSFGDYVTGLPEMRAAVAWFLTRACEKLRRHRLAAGSITVFMETNRFKTDDPQYANSVSFSIAPMSDNTREIMELAQRGVEAIYKNGFRYKRGGVTLGKLAPVEAVPLRLWEDEDHQRNQALMEAVDHLNRKYGQDTVKCGWFPTEGKWRTRFAQLSPRYTTRWDELLCVGDSLKS